MNDFQRAVASDGIVPVSYVASTHSARYLNLGDALSAVMVSLVSGLPVRHVAMQSSGLRMGAVGTIAQNFRGGEVWLWGTGSSRWADPSAPTAKKVLYTPPPDTRLRVTATRGPVSRAILGEDNAVGGPAFGDPVWLLPQFHRPKVEKRWKLGVIIHLADLADRTFTAVPKEAQLRYRVGEADAADVHLITMVTDTTVEAMRERVDEILACERIVSTSLHGMVIAEAYGIPCLYFSPRGTTPGVVEVDLDPDGDLDLRIVDLYLGAGRKRLPIFTQSRRQETDWGGLIDAIDRTWEPTVLDTDPLLEAFPLPLSPITAAEGETVFGDPIVLVTPVVSGTCPFTERTTLSGAASAKAVDWFMRLKRLAGK